MIKEWLVLFVNMWWSKKESHQQLVDATDID